MSQLKKEAYGPTGDSSKHRRLADLRAGLEGLGTLAKDEGVVSLIVRRLADGTRESLPAARLDPELGVPGDGWNRRPPRDLEAQLAVMCQGIAALIANGQPLTLFGDNLFVTLDLSAANLPTGTRIAVGEAVVEMTPQPHNGCSKFKQRFGADGLELVQAPATRHLNLRGVYWKVVTAGDAAVGDPVRVVSRP